MSGTGAAVQCRAHPDPARPGSPVAIFLFLLAGWPAPALEAHQPIHSERRRPLGGPRSVSCARGGQLARVASSHGDGGSMGEQVANMIQPFWALPVLAIAGISLPGVMAFTVMSFLVGVVVFGSLY